MAKFRPVKKLLLLSSDVSRDICRFLRRHWTEIVLSITVIAVILAFWGISAAELPLGIDLSATAQAPVFVQKAYRVARVFSFDFDPQDILNWQLQIAAMLAVVVVSGVIITFLGRAWKRVRLHLLSIWGGHVVIVGLSPIGLHLARGYRALTRDRNGVDLETARLVIIEGDRENPHIPKLRDAGAIVLIGNAADEELLELARARKARRVFAVTGNNGVNLEIAGTLLDGARRTRPGAVCHIHLSDRDLADAIAGAFNEKRRKDALTVEVFNLYTSTSRCCLLNEMSADLACNQGIEHYFIFGFSEQGQALAREIALLAHFANDKRSRLTIADHDLPTTRDPFLQRYPAFCPEPGTLDLAEPPEGLDDWSFSGLRPHRWAQYPEGHPNGAPPVPKSHTPVEYICNAEFLEMPAALDCPEFLEQLAKRLNRPEIKPVLFVCIEEEDRENFEAAHQLQKGLLGLVQRSLRLHIWLPRGSSLQQFLHAREMAAPGAETPVKISLKAFGDPHHVCSQKNITQPPLEEIAQEIHENYRATLSEEKRGQISGQPWARLPESLRQSNRLRAAHIDIKLRMLGLERRSRKEADPSRILETIEDPEAMELIAQAEHNRWNAERLLNGWRYAPQTDKARRHHNNLLPYHQLPDEIKTYDRSALSEILKLVKSRGECVLRQSRNGSA